MKKNGYTLAEALIAMCVIGVVAAVTLPLASKYMPDSNKVIFLKTYDSIASVNQSITSSTEFYPIVNNPQFDRRIYKNYPLYNTSATTVIDGVTYGGDRSKYCKFLALGLGTNANACSAGYSANPAWSEGNRSFTTKNGVDVMVFTNMAEDAVAGSITYRSDIYIDVDGFAKGVNCEYNSATCKYPDRFKLAIGPDGDIAAVDAKGQEYLKTRTNYRKNRDEDDLNVAALDPNFDERLLELIPEEAPPVGPGGAPGGDEDDDDDERPDLPSGHKYADWVNTADLRTTNATGVYCEQHNPSMPEGNFDNQRHVYWHQEAQAWVELEGVYYVSSGEYNFPPYTGEGAGSIVQW